jgi:hypothetical protein
MKDNLARRNWNGNKQCCFSHKNETIKHLFFECIYLKILWGLLFVTLNIVPPPSVRQLFGSWLNQFGAKLKRQVLAGALAFCWAIWLSRNDVVFDKTPIKLMWSLTKPLSNVSCRYSLASAMVNM